MNGNVCKARTYFANDNISLCFEKKNDSLKIQETCLIVFIIILQIIEKINKNFKQFISLLFKSKSLVYIIAVNSVSRSNS